MSLLRSPSVAYVPTARKKKDRSGSRKKRFEGAGPYARPTNKTSPSGGNIFGFYVTVQAPDPIGEKRVWISKPPIKLERLRKFLNRKFGKNITHENYEIVRAPNTALGWDWAVVINDDWDIDQPMTLTFTRRQNAAPVPALRFTPTSEQNAAPAPAPFSSPFASSRLQRTPIGRNDSSVGGLPLPAGGAATMSDDEDDSNDSDDSDDSDNQIVGRSRTVQRRRDPNRIRR